MGDQQDILKHFDKLFFKHEGMKINIALDLPGVLLRGLISNDPFILLIL